MTARRVRIFFGAGCLATTLALTWAGVAVPESRKNVKPDMCSIDDGAETGPGIAAAWIPGTSVPTAIAGVCPVNPRDTPSSEPPVDAALAVPVVQPPAAVQNLRRADQP